MQREQLITAGLCKDCGRPFAKDRFSRTKRCLSCKTNTCEVCGVGFRPSRGGDYVQRTCGRACGQVIHSGPERSRWPVCKVHVLTCDACGGLYVAHMSHQLHDRPGCRRELQRRREQAERRRWVETFGRETASGQDGRHLSYVERLMSRFEIAESGCWRWTSTFSHNGYGRIQTPSGSSPAYRAMWEHLVGPIAPGMELDHQCHNLDPSCPGGTTCPHRGCVNPVHLREVTPADNNAAKLARRPPLKTNGR